VSEAAAAGDKEEASRQRVRAATARHPASLLLTCTPPPTIHRGLVRRDAELRAALLAEANRAHSIAIATEFADADEVCAGGHARCRT